MERPKKKFKFGAKLNLKGIPNKAEDFMNKLNADFKSKTIAVGTENGQVAFFKLNSITASKVLKTDPWTSSLQQDYPHVWISGMSRQVKCLRYYDNALVFHLNRNVEMQNFGSEIIFFWLF